MKRTPFYLAVLMCLLTRSAAFAADGFVLAYPNEPSRIFKSTDEIVLSIPDKMSDEELSSIFIELDGVDITQSFSLNGSEAVYQPSESYLSGRHTLRVVKAGAGQSLTEVKRWQFLVAAADGTVPDRMVTIEGTVDGTYAARLLDNIDDSHVEPDLQNIQSQADVSLNGQAGTWAASLTANGFANTDNDNNPGGDGMEIGEYLIDAKNTLDDFSMRFRLGNHDIDADNLLLNQFHRRGFSGFIDSVKNRIHAGGFFMNPSPLSGNRNLTGLNEDDQQIAGAYGTWQPSGQLGDKLELEGTLYQGEGSENGSGSVSVFSDANEGRGYQLGVKSSLIPDRLILRAQAAHTNFDQDSSGTDFEAQDANAYKMSLLWVPYESAETESGTPRDIQFEASYFRSDADYQSLLNTSTESDREIWDLKSSYLYDQWTADGYVTWLRDNIEGNPLLPADGSLQGGVNISYALPAEAFGAPVLSFGGLFSDDRRLDTPSGYTGDDLDRLTSSLNAGVTFSFEDTTWNVMHTYTELNDKADSANDNVSHYTDLSLEYRVNDRLTLSPGIQSEWVTQESEGSSQNWHLSLGEEYQIIPEKLTHRAYVTSQIDRGTTVSDGRHYGAETELTWVLQQAQINKPGYALSLNGQYDNDTNTYDPADEEIEEGRVFVRFKVTAPFAR